MRLLRWTVAIPALALLVLVATWGSKPAAVGLMVVGGFLAGSVRAAVHHAEVVAHRVGEPFGSLVLAVAVTVIEVALNVTLMVSGGSETATLARDTVFAAVMITSNGIVGLCLFVGALRQRVASFNAEGTATALATVLTLATLSLVLPTFTTSRPGHEFSPAQLVFAAMASIALYALFLVVQTVRHRDYFLPVGADAAIPTNTPHRPPTGKRLAVSGYWRSRSSRLSGWPRSSLQRSRTRSRPSARRRPPSASSSRCWCYCRRRSPPSATRAVIECRRASTSHSAPQWRASG